MKELIIKELEIMSKNAAINKEFFKIRAYNKVIDQIKLLDKVETFDNLSKITGIGKQIKLKIEEILETGKLKVADEIRKKGVVQIYDELLKIYGIGVVKAKELVEKLKIVCIEQLEKELEKNPKILNDKQKIGLKYYLDTQQSISRKEIDLHSIKIKKIIADAGCIDPDLQIDIVGSYRRETKNSGDIDILITINRNVTFDKRTKTLKKFIETLQDANYILANLNNGSKKYMGICALLGKGQTTKNKECEFGNIARRIDVLITSREEYPFALLYFTGSYELNIIMRKRAIEMGYILNEYGLKSNFKGKKIKNGLNSEKEIFNFLGYEYLKPVKRSDMSNLKKLFE